MVDITLIDTLQPIMNILGGVAGVTIIYFIIVIRQNIKKSKLLQRIIDRQELERKELRLMNRRIEELNGKVTRWKRSRSS